MCPAGREMMGGFICKRRKKRKKKKKKKKTKKRVECHTTNQFFFFFFFVFFCVWPFYLSPLKTPKECEMAGCAVPIGVHSIARESTSQQVNTKLTEKKVKKKEKRKTKGGRKKKERNSDHNGQICLWKKKNQKRSQSFS